MKRVVEAEEDSKVGVEFIKERGRDKRGRKWVGRT